MAVTRSRLQGSRRLGEHVRLEEPDSGMRRALDASEIMIRERELDEARRLLRAAVRSDPSCAEAWLRLAWLAESRQERKALLHQVLALEPEHMKARAELDRVDTPSAGPSDRPAAKGRAPAGEPAQGWIRLLPRLWLWWLAALVCISAAAALIVWGPMDVSRLWFWPTPAATTAPRPTDSTAQVAARFVPMLEDALSTADWERALEVVALMRGVDPSGGDMRHWALTTRVLYGQALVEDGRAHEALAQFDEAVAAVPEDAEARLWQETTRTYLTGWEALEAGDWGAAAQSLTLVYEQIPSYSDAFTLLVEALRRLGQAAIEAESWTQAIEALSQADETARSSPAITDLLFQAHYGRGLRRQEQGELQAARADLEAALALRPDEAQVQAQLDEVMERLFPPKKIEIDISKQRLHVWEGTERIHTFVISTGLRGQDTATGHFEVLDKMPMAYSSLWRLKMPYWLGIYYARDIENGIHALPIRPDGSVMWAGLLGQRASYGCVILDNEAAQTLYEWAEIGTPVHIHN